MVRLKAEARKYAWFVRSDGVIKRDLIGALVVCELSRGIDAGNALLEYARKTHQQHDVVDEFMAIKKKRFDGVRVEVACTRGRNKTVEHGGERHVTRAPGRLVFRIQQRHMVKVK